MITPKNRDMNRSRDVAGPELKRSYDQEMPMKSTGLKDSAPTGVISKHSLSELHFGEHESPVTATGMQDVVVPADMGREHQMDHPGTRKGFKTTSTNRKNEVGSRNPKGMGRSVAKDLIEKEKIHAK